MVDFDLVIFDCDGVLIDSEVLSCQCLADLLVREGLPITLEEVFDRFLGRGFAVVPDYYRECTGRPLRETFRHELRTLQSDCFSASLKPMPHIGAVLSRLDLPYCLASSSDPERIRLSLSLTGLDRFFEGRVFDVTMAPRTKPAPDLFLLAARTMGARPDRTLVIEDSVNGVLAGKAAGMEVWGFIGGSHYRGRAGHDLLSRAGADRVFDTMVEFSPYAAALAP